MDASGLPRTAEGCAFFLDVDGTLLDIADEPNAVRVPDGLADDLKALSEKAEGALALITGRSIAFIEGLMPQLGLPIAGLHGAERRRSDGSVDLPVLDDAFHAALADLRDFAAAHPSMVMESKGAAFAAHYRKAPMLEASLRGFMGDLARKMGDRWILQEGKFVFEIRPAGHDKGDVLRAFMADPPFLGRRPVAVGDDLTDEAMFAAANAMGGFSIRVGASAWETAAMVHVSSPNDVRNWIRGLAT